MSRSPQLVGFLGLNSGLKVDSAPVDNVLRVS